MHHLPLETIRLLSSSQVITSVVSVVKELVENALDANANSIEIKLENFGFDKIEVQDNGDGIKAADAPVMGIKHYTSKITIHEDLEALETYGFRGEALGSICSVAEVHITTKTAADEISTQYVLGNSGHVVSQKPSHLGQGTTVTVLHLFKNLPVRKQYFSTTKKCKAELKKVQDLLMAYGIIKPGLRIVLVHNKMVVWQKNKVLDHKMALMSLLGTTVMNSMVPFQHQDESEQIRIHGFLPKREADSSATSSSSSERCFIFINQRPVYHKEILKMVRSYYSEHTTSRSYPVFFMNIVVPASFVDVNLTPDKTQVMLQNKESVLSAVEITLKSVYSDPVLKEVDRVNAQFTEADVNIKDPSKANDGKDVIVETTDPLEQNAYTHLNNNDGKLESETEALLTDPSAESGIWPNNNRQQHSSTEHVKDDEADREFECNTAGKPTEYKNTISNNSLETSNDNWSKGTAFKNSKGENLQPVTILCSSSETNTNQSCEETGLIEGPKNTEKKSTNVISEKSGFITAFDLMSNRVIKKPMSARDIFTQEYRISYLKDTPKVGFDDLSTEMLDLWEQLGEEEKLKYEEKATKDLQRYRQQTAKATEKNMQKPKEAEKRPRQVSGESTAQKIKRKTALSNQQILDTLFKSQVEKKASVPAVKTIQIAFSLNSLKQKNRRLPGKEVQDTEFSLINKLNFPGAWVLASKRTITLLNPYRMEEMLLYKRLVDNYKIPVEILDSPIVLTHRLVGETDYLSILLGMQKDYPKPNGHIYFSDPRLASNGFLIKMIPGSPDSHVEIEGMTSILPFYGISDLKEILNFVMQKNTRELCDCRPLKVLNYLEGEAVRLARQLPLTLAKDDVYDTLSRMKKQFGDQTKGCIHGRPFYSHLADIPQDDE
ncbi:PMS1 protein homolog 1 isoform X1 [Aquarana catesbeiana]|uniref:PMS1 protein homolog 1 isoform X1 n=1 Tax=Aquarana catesbeiana TaxID=8400 RepID=UPI003CCA6277